MAFLGVFVFTGVGGEVIGLEANVDQFYEDTNLADGWIYSPYLDDLFLEQVYSLGATTQVERQVVINSEADFENSPEITLHFVENNTISKFYLIEGEPLDINDPDGVWLDKSFADAKGLKVGDNITFTFQDYEIQKEIKGLGYSPEYTYHASTYSVIPDFNRIGFAYLSYKAFPTDTVPYNVLNVKFDGTPETYSEILDYHLGGYYISFLEKSEHSSVKFVSDQISLQTMMADVFPIVFILISMLMLLTTMTRIIAYQRTQIGILKANGFRNMQILLHYLSYGFLLVLIGSLSGLILGPVILPDLIYSVMRTMVVLPSWEPMDSTNFVYVLVLMVLMSLAVSFYSAKSILNEKPSDSIKPKSPRISSKGFIERLGIWNKLSFNIRWNYRDVRINKFRSLMTIIGVIGCTALLICAFGLNDSMNDLSKWEFGEINHYNSELFIYDGASQSAVDEVLNDTGGDEIMRGVVEIESPSAKKSGELLVLDGTDLITPTDDNWNKIEIKDDDVSISRKMADLLGVNVGDSVKWHLMDSNKWVNTKITKIHSDSDSQGLIMSKNKLEELNLNYTPTSILTADSVDKNYSAIKDVNSMDERVGSWQDLTLAAYILIYILIISASILSIITLYNLGLLLFTEIEREIATLKVFGFKTNVLRNVLLTQNLLFTTIGFVVGIPVGIFILKKMWESSGDSFYVIPSLSPTTILFTAIITFSLSLIVNLMFSYKINKLNMVESIKSNE